YPYTRDRRKRRRYFSFYFNQSVTKNEISVKTGEQMKLDVLLSRADKVETNSSGEWTEVWKRGHGVWSDRLTDTDGNLTIKNFTSNDTGTYRVLDSEGEVLITVTVTGERRSVDARNIIYKVHRLIMFSPEVKCI
uniref:Immunoglobulin subtype domain-containing protein n=1 Tax=Sinocyclocheilus grahami TaxID=75366 RepID=A0A672PN99_SINGR